jgi:hypothetical protein
MKYESLIKRFVHQFPELNAQIEDVFQKWSGDTPPVHVFFGDVLNKYLVHELQVSYDPALLSRIFNFMNMMAKSKDQEVRAVLTDTILEYLGDDKDVLKIARSFMKPETLQLSFQIELHLGRE